MDNNSKKIYRTDAKSYSGREKEGEFALPTKPKKVCSGKCNKRMQTTIHVR